MLKYLAELKLFRQVFRCVDMQLRRLPIHNRACLADYDCYRCDEEYGKFYRGSPAPNPIESYAMSAAANPRPRASSRPIDPKNLFERIEYDHDVLAPGSIAHQTDAPNFSLERS